MSYISIAGSNELVTTNPVTAPVQKFQGVQQTDPATVQTAPVDTGTGRLLNVVI